MRVIDDESFVLAVDGDLSYQLLGILDGDYFIVLVVDKDGGYSAPVEDVAEIEIEGIEEVMLEIVFH